VETFHLAPSAEAASYRLQVFDAIGSTNSEGLMAATRGDDGPAWFVTANQTAGRGRRGRTWSTAEGNLAASLLIAPQVPTDTLPTLGFVAGVALRQALSAIAPTAFIRTDIDGGEGEAAGEPARFALKWPNDVLADGSKLAGILLEAQSRPNRSGAVVIGFGVNVVTHPTDLPYPATSLAALGMTVTAADMFVALSRAWVETYAIWNRGQGVADILSLWRRSAAGIGAAIAVKSDGETVRGIFETVDSQGRLVVRTENDRHVAVSAGDVHFGTTASLR
jgi:BirA family transcriptional regulator, biotin operon repressor / biotin---[acetyl-CoA-carboxylase] ligase